MSVGPGGRGGGGPHPGETSLLGLERKRPCSFSMTKGILRAALTAARKGSGKHLPEKKVKTPTSPTGRIRRPGLSSTGDWKETRKAGPRTKKDSKKKNGVLFKGRKMVKGVGSEQQP